MPTHESTDVTRPCSAQPRGGTRPESRPDFPAPLATPELEWS
jgi:hypothetical protein